MPAAETDSYCAIADVQAICQIGTFATDTVPTNQQVLEFQAQRAGQLYTILADVMGTDAPGPSGYSTAISTSTDAGKALNWTLVHYNSIGAAMDALQAAGAGEVPGRSERIAELFAMWEGREKALRPVATMYVGYSTRTATHISTGEITEKSITAREEDGLVFDGSTSW